MMSSVQVDATAHSLDAIPFKIHATESLAKDLDSDDDFDWCNAIELILEVAASLSKRIDGILITSSASRFTRVKIVPRERNI